MSHFIDNTIFNFVFFFSVHEYTNTSLAVRTTPGSLSFKPVVSAACWSSPSPPRRLMNAFVTQWTFERRNQSAPLLPCIPFPNNAQHKLYTHKHNTQILLKLYMTGTMGMGMKCDLIQILNLLYKNMRSSTPSGFVVSFYATNYIILL